MKIAFVLYDQAALLAARSGMAVADSPLREALGEFVRAAGLVRRIGVNLNRRWPS
jgi:hypothetical protein